MDAIAAQGLRFASEWAANGLVNLASLAETTTKGHTTTSNGSAKDDSVPSSPLVRSSDHLIEDESKNNLADRYNTVQVDRGASFFKQVWLCHVRSLKKQVTV